MQTTAKIASLPRLSSQVWAAGQLLPHDLAGLRAAGFTCLVNHRPDDEEPGQPRASEIARAGAAAGLKVVHAPARGLPDDAAVRATRDVLDALKPDDRAVFFCRSAIRSAAAWAMAERLAGADARVLRDAAAAAGYDLSRVPL